jgi:hypothetical protein
MRTAGGIGVGIDRLDLLGGLGQRLAPQPEDVALLAADPVGGFGGAADRDRDSVLVRPDVGLESLEPVVLAREADRALLGPDPAQDLDELGRPLVALLLGRVVALAPLLGSLPPEMMWMPSRPRPIRSMAANAFAASVGKTKPGRCASIGLTRSELFTTNWAICAESAVGEPYATRVQSKPPSSSACTKRRV